MKIEGEAIYVDSTGKRHSVEGVGSLPDDILFKSLNVSGSCSFANISCDKVKIEGECVGKSINAKKISASGSIEIDAMKIDGDLEVSGSVDSEFISAKEIVMESRGGSIGEIKCDTIRIFESEGINGSIFSKIFGRSSHANINSRVRIKKIDAVTVDLQNCSVNEITCVDAIIGENCAIEKLTVAGKCDIAANSTVGKTIRANQ
ncbi:MAG: hypothetical protein IJT06_02605 [Selenomonadaceae bacterium]|nr:hypothetical protein [Selenomonadaceae bacterium]